MRPTNWLIFIIFASAFLLRLGDSLRPIDSASWREADMASIARNFATEGMDPRFPRIDWRGDGPGYVEMEFPFTSWITALTYKVLGVHDVFGRIWSLIFSVGALFLFFQLAREYLGDIGSAAATAFFAFNPLIVEASTAFKPESAMMLAYIGAVHFFLKWFRTEANRDLILAALLTSLTLLAKATAAHIGIMFGFLLIQKHGVTILRQSKVWLFGAVSVLPAIAWYLHAKKIWLSYGNSLGVSNEYHWVGWDFFTNTYFARGILGTEIIDVWVIFGLAGIVFALIYAAHETVVRWSLIWIGSIFVMYIAAARTTADDWASYYHIFSVTPAAILFGVGTEGIIHQTSVWADKFSQREMSSNFLRIVVIILAMGACGMTFTIDAVRARGEIMENRLKDPDFQFARSIKPQLSRDGLILVSGGPCFDDDGYPVAFNKSYLFYALERKGTNICVEEQSVQNVISYANGGYVYFVAQRMEMDKRPGFADALEKLYKAAARNDNYTIFALQPEESR
jgi:4-amino-4-deoxy-L-arabinose transferase-like glycosyltransferase